MASLAPREIAPREDAPVQSPDPAQYNGFAAHYEEHAAVAPYNALYDRPATLRVVGDVAGRRVLDGACGPGFYVETFLAAGAEVIGCDAAPAMVDLARLRVGDRAQLEVHSLDDPFSWVEAQTIDVVVCALAYHYLSNRAGFLAEAHRMLRPGGSLVISTHHPTADWVRLGGSYFEESAVTEVWSTGWEITAWRVPLTQLCEEFTDAGFVIERLIEPLPDDDMRESHPDIYRKLSTAPGFIVFRLGKAR
jgi:SAM-dependent methyltransferase